MVKDQNPYRKTLDASAAPGAAALLGEEVTALQALVDILNKSHDGACESCGGSGITGRSLCEQCRGRGILTHPASPHLSALQRP